MCFSGLCLVCVKAWTVWLVSISYHKPSLHTNHPFKQTIPSCKPSLHTNHPITETIPSHKPSLHTNHPFTQSNTSQIPSLHTNNLSFTVLHLTCSATTYGNNAPSPSLHTNQTISLHTIHPFTQTIPSHKPFIILCITSLHTNHPFTETIYYSLYYILSSLHTNHLSLHANHPFTQTITSHKPLFIPFTQTIPSHKPSLHTIHLFSQTIPSHNPSLHTKPCLQTNHLSFSVLHIVWFVWRDGLCVGMVCVKGWHKLSLHKPSLHTNHPFTQTR